MEKHLLILGCALKCWDCQFIGGHYNQPCLTGRNTNFTLVNGFTVKNCSNNGTGNHACATMKMSKSQIRNIISINKLIGH